MARSVICDNCGHRIAVDEGYTRRKIRCPECGVTSEVTDAPRPGAADPRPAKRSAPSAPEPSPQVAEELARQLWSEPNETPPPKKSEPPPPPREEKPEPVPERPVVEVVERKRPPPPGPPKRPAQTWTEEDEDSSPYEVSGGPERKCPQCFRVLEPEAVLCVRCGLDLKSGKQLVREFKPIARS